MAGSRCADTPRATGSTVSAVSAVAVGAVGAGSGCDSRVSAGATISARSARSAITRHDCWVDGHPADSARAADATGSAGTTIAAVADQGSTVSTVSAGSTGRSVSSGSTVGAQKGPALSRRAHRSDDSRAAVAAIADQTRIATVTAGETVAGVTKKATPVSAIAGSRRACASERGVRVTDSEDRTCIRTCSGAVLDQVESRTIGQLSLGALFKDGHDLELRVGL